MMIEKHISALLYRYQCVIIPGFGAFLAETKSAQLNADTHTFYPPEKSISFNANLKNNDGLLANHIALQEKISYEDALTKIKYDVSHWFDELQNNKNITIKDLGHINVNTEGSLVFTPDTPVNYLTDAFGLSSFTSPAVKREEYKAIAEAVEEKAPIVFTAERKRDYSFIKYAAMFAVMATVGVGGFKIYHDQKVENETLIVQQAVQEKVQQQIQQATFFIGGDMPTVALPVKEEVTIKPYQVVAGAYRSEENAHTAVAQLKEKGFENATTIEQNKYGLYPVIYNSYSTHQEAKQALKQIRYNENYDAWLLIK